MPIRVQEADFDVSAEISALADANAEIGAIATFIGKVRGDVDGQPLTAMILEHYPEMTDAELARIADEAAQRFRLTAVSVVHRFGVLKPRENIVLVIACAAHRQDAFEGCAYVMDYLKTRAPFWKKETTASGQGRWVDTRESDEAAVGKWDHPKR